MTTDEIFTQFTPAITSEEEQFLLDNSLSSDGIYGIPQRSGSFIYSEPLCYSPVGKGRGISGHHNNQAFLPDDLSGLVSWDNSEFYPPTDAGIPGMTEIPIGFDSMTTDGDTGVRNPNGIFKSVGRKAVPLVMLVGLGLLSAGCGVNQNSTKDNCAKDYISPDECGIELKTEEVEPKIEFLEHMIQSADISPSSKSTLTDAMRHLRVIMAEDRIRWYKWKDDTNRANVSIGPSKFEELLGSKKFPISVLSPDHGSEIYARDLGLFFHELFHAVNADKKHSMGLDWREYMETREFEYESVYYEELVTIMAIQNGLKDKERQTIMESFGIYLPEVVYQLDKLNIGPDKQLFQFICDMHYRYVVLQNQQEYETMLIHRPGDEEAAEKIMKDKELIKELDDLWIGYPRSGSDEEKFIEQIISQGLAKPETFHFGKKVKKGFSSNYSYNGIRHGFVGKQSPISVKGAYGTKGFPIRQSPRG